MRQSKKPIGATRWVGLPASTSFSAPDLLNNTQNSDTFSGVKAGTRMGPPVDCGDIRAGGGGSGGGAAEPLSGRGRLSSFGRGPARLRQSSGGIFRYVMARTYNEALDQALVLGRSGRVQSISAPR